MTKPTRKQLVLDLLIRAAQTDSSWVDGHVICSPSCGGSEGLRRVRELRADGYVIERRKRPERATNQYRIVLEPHQLSLMEEPQ